MPFPSLVCGVIDTTINQLLTRDASATQRMAPLVNKAFKLTLKEYQQPLFFFFSAQRVEIFNKYEGELDVELTLGLSALAKLQDNGAITQLIKSEQLIIVGDIKLLQQFAELLTDLDIDWPDQLAPYTGDVLAYHSANLITKTASKLKSVATATHRQCGEYLIEELALAPSQLEFIHLSDQIDDVAQQVAQLESRIAQLRS